MTSSSPDVVAIVLAGGASSRFGSDKLAAELDGKPLLHHALEAVAAVAGSIVVVLAPEAPLPSVPRGLADRVVFAKDAAAHGGPLAGLAAGLAAIDTPVADEAPPINGAGGGVRGGGVRGGGVVLVVGGDMPSLVPAVLRLLARSLAADASLAAMTLAASDPAPLPMTVRPAAVGAAVSAILAGGGRRSLRVLLDSLPAAELPEVDWRVLDPTGATLRDVDAPADLQAG
jgi:molybdopterin-guanine dinucleotide biosynthesis protein A